MTRKHSQIVTQIKVIASDAKSFHCSYHQKDVAARKLLAILKTVLTEAVKVVTLIKFKAKNSR
jgi:hypothetical protein